MAASGTYQTIRPKDEFLRKYIAYYYFDECLVEGEEKSFIFYPHFRNAITVYRNSGITLDKYTSLSSPSEQEHPTIIYTGVGSNARYAKMIAPYTKIGIVFQPLGINYFLPKGKVIQDEVSWEKNGLFNALGDDFEQCMQSCFSQKSISEQVDLMDRFFNAHFRPFAETRLIKAVDILMNDHNITAQALADSLSFSRKTLYRLFKKHLNSSFETYKSVVKFRKAVESFDQSEDKKSLTYIAYTNNYYDQSDFINHIKKMTGFNPKKFFSELSNVGTEDTRWTFTK